MHLPSGAATRALIEARARLGLPQFGHQMVREGLDVCIPLWPEKCLFK